MSIWFYELFVSCKRKEYKFFDNNSGRLLGTYLSWTIHFLQHWDSSSVMEGVTNYNNYLKIITYDAPR